MLRFIVIIIIFFPYCIAFYFKAKRAVKNKNMTVNERYGIVREMICKICKKSRITVNTYGAENLPKEDGYALAPNHQGRFDGLAIIKSSERNISFLIDEKRSNMPIEKTIVDALGCVRIDRSDLAKVRNSLRQLGGVIKSGRNIAVFPEGQWSDNKNELQEFKTGALSVLSNIGCPIVPVCLYDTYKVYGINSLKKVSCQVHFLSPIYYEEYKDMSRSELGDLIKQRISEKLNELKGQEQKVASDK